MLRFVELCVNLRKGKMAKEGLYQFKNIAQNTNVSSIEVPLHPILKFSDTLELTRIRQFSKDSLNLRRERSQRLKHRLNASF